MRKLANFKWAILLGLIGIGFTGLAVASLIGSFREGGTSVAAPGETVVDINKAGDYTLWNETKTVLDGQVVSFPDELPAGATITIAKQPEGTPVPLRLAGKTSVEVNGKRKVSAGEVTFPGPGKYKVAVTGLENKRVLSLGESRFFKTFLNVLFYGLGGVIFLFAALAVGIYATVRLSKESREERAGLSNQPPVIGRS